MTRQEKSSKMGVRCHVCDTICTGEVLKVQDKHFHIKCFTCTECQESLASGGYFLKDNVYYCKKDYQRLFGMKCAHCERYVEGRVVTALGKMYHPDCFICSQCRNPISTGAVLTGSGTKILCHTCGAHHSKKGPAPTTSPLAYLSEQKTSQSPPHVTSPYPMSSSSNFSLTSTSSNDPTSPNSTHPALPTRYRPSPPPGLSTTFNQYMGSRSAKPLERRERVEGTRSQASSSTSLSQQQQQNPSHGSHSRTSSLPVFTPPPSDGHAHHSSQSLSLSRHPPAHASKSVQYSPSPSPASITHRVSTPLLDLPGGGVGGGSAHSLNRVSSGVPSYPDSPYFVSSHQRSMSLDRGRSMNSSEVDGAVPSGSSPHQHPPPREGGSSGDPGNIKMGVCAGCKESISTTGTSLLALAQHWHTRCLCCVKCSRGVLDEVVNSDGVPYCLDCFNRDRGSICASCQQYILGTGLQAADQSFHLDCAKCNRCGSGFEENEDMCLLASFRGLDYVFLDAPVSGVLEQLRCPICLQLPAEPVSTSCGHLFCEDCIKTLPSCPLCRRAESFTASPDDKIRQVVNHLRVRCPNSAKGCEWQGRLGEALEHLGRECAELQTNCPYGCGERTESRSQLEEHIGGHCPNRPFQCQYCGSRVVRRNRKTHYTTCQHFLLKCPGVDCRQRFARKSLRHHLSNECPGERVPCKYAMLGCCAVVKRREMKDHLAKSSHHSIPWPFSTPTLGSPVQSSSDTLLDLVYAKFIPLSSRPWLRNKPTSYPVPPWVVKLEGFEEKKGRGVCWLSEPVHSHYGGYKMCLRVIAGGDHYGSGTHVSLYAHLMRGDNDDNLEFPFSGTVAISLLNQEEDRNHCSVDLWSPQDDVPLDVCQRVRLGSKAVVAWGCPDLFSHEGLGHNSDRNRTYLKRDTLFLRIDKFEPAY